MLQDIIRERLRKLENFRKSGIEPYPAKTKRTHLIGEVLADFNKLQRSKKKIFLAGRIIGLRGQGGVVFIDLQDWSGKIQLVLKKDNLTKLDFMSYRDNLDIGDFVECGGAVFKTKRGERSLEVKNIKLLVKSIRPLPDQWYGLEDVEMRLRQRYLDLLLRPEVREMFIKKNKFWEAVRGYLKTNEFIEVETPVLEAIPGGADAEPFTTHHNALDSDFYLRISLELPLKKLLVGGFEKAFEIGRVFRNEGIDAEHLQDYTQCEFYWAYQDYEELMKFVEKMYKEVIKGTVGGLKTKCQGKVINWGGKWPRNDYYQLFKKYVGLDLKKATIVDLKKRAQAEGIKVLKAYGRGKLIDLLYKKLVRQHLIQPCFLINPPVDVEPLAKRLPSDDGRVERMQVIACGTELGKGFSELNDPVDQRRRFEEQMKLRRAGNKEAQMLDEEFLMALEYGMPPAAGFGLSERLFAVLMDKPVREAVIFPLMKRK
ncbi:MAG: lysine--tRNA ligase [Patescibacteria group bacterium]